MEDSSGGREKKKNQKKRQEKEKERKSGAGDGKSKETGTHSESSGTRCAMATQIVEVVSHKGGSSELLEGRLLSKDELDAEELEENRETYLKRFKRAAHLVQVGELSKAMTVIPATGYQTLMRQSYSS